LLSGWWRGWGWVVGGGGGGGAGAPDVPVLPNAAAHFPQDGI